MLEARPSFGLVVDDVVVKQLVEQLGLFQTPTRQALRQVTAAWCGPTHR